jgi:signal transduction histidine kinase
MTAPALLDEPLPSASPGFPSTGVAITAAAPNTGHTEDMLRAATWFVRVTVIVGIGLETFTGSTARGATIGWQVAAYAIGVALVGVWGAMDRWRAGRPSWARWLPVVLAVMAACSAPTTSKDGGALIAFGFMAAVAGGSDSNLATGWIVTAVGVLATVAGGVVGGASVTATFGYSLLLIFALLAGHNRRSYRVQAEQAAILLDQFEQLRAEQRQVAVLDERNRIAREIHDVLAHSLGALSIQIQTARVLLSDQRDIDRSLSALDKAQRMVADGLTETRRAVLALRSDTQPLTDELALLAENHRSRHHTAVSLDVDGVCRALAPEAELALLRTAQESLVNAAKHSEGQSVATRLDYGKRHTTLTITNRLSEDRDGAGSFGTIDGGYGLLGMRERLLLLGGSLTAGPDGDYWTVTALVPQ